MLRRKYEERANAGLDIRVLCSKVKNVNSQYVVGKRKVSFVPMNIRRRTTHTQLTGFTATLGWLTDPLPVNLLQRGWITLSVQNLGGQVHKITSENQVRSASLKAEDAN